MQLGKAEKEKDRPLLLSFRETSHKINFMDNLKKPERNPIPKDQHGSRPYQKTAWETPTTSQRGKGKTIPRFGGPDIQGGRSPINVDCEKNEKKNTPPSTKPRIQTNNRGSDSRECRGQGPPTGGHRKELTGETGQTVHTSVNNVNTPNAVNMF